MTKNPSKVALIGFGLEGESALGYWLEQGADVTVCDADPEKKIPAGVKKQLGEDYLHDLDRFDVIVRTVGMHPKIILEQNPGVQAKITTNINEFFKASPTKNIIGVTGTKGKGTTSTLILEMLKAMGKDAYLGGNFGIPAFTFLPKLTKDSWVVLELSSYMLYDLKYSPHIAVCLMVVPEHLDWHGDQADYHRSKGNLFRHQTPKDVAIYYANNRISHDIARNSPGDKIPYYDEPGAYMYDDKIMIDQTVLCKTGELKLMGKHNWQNVCAAATAVWQVAQTPAPIQKVLATFAGLPHRLELVRELDGVKYYNDSFSSDPYAAEAAIAAIPSKKVMIMGGYERMIPLESLAERIKDHSDDIRGILLIGDSAERFAGVLKTAGYTNFHLSPAKTMSDIIKEANALAEKGDSIVLSPGFASFGLFKNFEVRGNQFKEVVNAL